MPGKFLFQSTIKLLHPNENNKLMTGSFAGSRFIHSIFFIVMALWVMASCLAYKKQPTFFPSEINLAEKGPDSFIVSFQTTKGDFSMKARRYWSPLASDRLFLLAKNGYYNGCVIYRVAPTASVKGGFVVQFGIGNDEAANRAWDKATIKDEPVVHPHSTGAVCFARGGPDTRSTELAITLTQSNELDTISYLGVTGFPTCAVVEEGMDVVKSFNGQYGNSVFDQEDSLLRGREFLDRVYPGLDRITIASVTKTWKAH